MGKTVARWNESFGGAENARAAGVTGRLAEVTDGTYAYVESTNERSAKEMLKRFARTASYTGQVTLHGRIVAADGSTADEARLTADFDRPSRAANRARGMKGRGRRSR